MNLLRTKLIENSSKLLRIAKRYTHCDKCSGAGEELRKHLFIPNQVEDPLLTRKITVVGATSKVGTSIAYKLLRNQICDELVLTDLVANKDKLCGTTLDLLHAKCYFDSPHLKIGADFNITENSDLIILCAGDVSKEKVTKEVAQANVNTLKKIVACLALKSPECVFIVVSYPVEITAYAVWKYSCFPKNRIVGLGTGLENSRFKYHLTSRLPVNPANVHSLVIGERDKQLIPIWSAIDVASTAIRDIDECVGKRKDKNKWQEVFDAVLTSDKAKGVNRWNTASYVAQLAKDILSDSRNIHTVTLRAKGIYDLDTEAFMSFPAVLGNRGIFQVVQQCYTDDEKQKLNCAIDLLDKLWASIKF